MERKEKRYVFAVLEGTAEKILAKILEDYILEKL